MRAPFAAAAALICATTLAPRERPTPAPGPTLWLWAWERPEDLRFLGGRQDVGVAVLTRTVVVGDDGVHVVRRRQPVLLPDGVARVTVVRVEVKRGGSALDIPPPGFAGSALDAHAVDAAGAVVEALSESGANALQIDFDSRPREYAFHRALLAHVRSRLPRGASLSITAMASWCMREGAFPDLGPEPVAVVPMFFAMGRGAEAVRLALSARGDFPVSACRGAIGVATDEPAPRLGPRPVWAFQRRPWTARDVDALLAADSPIAGLLFPIRRSRAAVWPS